MLAPPCLFPRDCFAELARLSGPRGARSVLERHADRVDAVAMLDFAAAWHAAHLEPGFRGLQPLIALDEEHEYYFGLHRDAPEALAARLQKALDGLRRDGELEQLTRHYLP